MFLYVNLMWHTLYFSVKYDRSDTCLNFFHSNMACPSSRVGLELCVFLTGETNGDEIFYLGFWRLHSDVSNLLKFGMSFLCLPLLWINFPQKTFDNFTGKVCIGAKTMQCWYHWQEWMCKPQTLWLAIWCTL